MRRTVRMGWIVMLAVTATARAQPAEFETAAPEPLAALLPEEARAGADYHLADPVAGDGLMHRFVVESRFGTFDAYGEVGLTLRRREIAALARLDETSGLGVVVGAVGDSVTGSARNLVGAATHPIDTVTGIPRGIANLFRGYTAQARELRDSAAGGDGHGAGTRAGADASRYVARYFGVSASERAWYRKLGVDPYTDNRVLQRTVQRLARIDATAKFGLKFASLPALPYAGEIGRAMDAIYNEPPALLRERRRGRLAGYGLTAEQIKRFENLLVLSPTRQQVLDEAGLALAGVEGRAELFRHALDLQSDDAAAAYVRSVVALVQVHAQHPLARIVPVLRIPAAEARDGTRLVVAAFDAVRWTEAVAGYEQTARAALAPDGDPLELWLPAAPSERAGRELAARGWTVRVGPAPSPAAAAPPS